MEDDEGNVHLGMEMLRPGCAARNLASCWEIRAALRSIARLIRLVSSIFLDAAYLHSQRFRCSSVTASDMVLCRN